MCVSLSCHVEVLGKNPLSGRVVGVIGENSPLSKAACSVLVGMFRGALKLFSFIFIFLVDILVKMYYLVSTLRRERA